MHPRARPCEDFPSCGWLWPAIGPVWFGTLRSQAKISQPQEAAGGIPKGRGPKHEGQAPPEAPGNNGNIITATRTVTRMQQPQQNSDTHDFVGMKLRHKTFHRAGPAAGTPTFWCRVASSSGLSHGWGRKRSVRHRAATTMTTTEDFLYVNNAAS